jgi:hypothetical protein
LKMWGYIAFPSNNKLEDETSHLVGKSRAEHGIWLIDCILCEIPSGLSTSFLSGRGKVRARLIPSNGKPLLSFHSRTLDRCFWPGNFWCLRRLRVLSQRDVPTWERRDKLAESCGLHYGLRLGEVRSLN